MINLSFLGKIGKSVAEHISRNGKIYIKVFGGMVFASVITAAACHHAYKQLEKKHRKEDAEKYKKQFKKRLKEIEKRYQHNEFLLKKKINELCDEFGIEHVC